MAVKLEEMIAWSYLPVNAKVMLKRLREILDEGCTNNFEYLKTEEQKTNFKRVLWMLNQQVYGQFAMIDLGKEWDDLVVGLPDENGVILIEGDKP